MKKISIVIPAYNEEGNINTVYQTLNDTLSKLTYVHEIIFTDDGSSDHTLANIKALASQHNNVFYIEFSRNFGHQAALKSGIDYASGDCVISMDCDMQHPPTLLPDMIKKWEEGYDIVYTRREDDERLPFFKRITSNLFYWINNKLSGVKLEKGVADFRLMDMRSAHVLAGLSERDLFIRGLVKWMGFRQYAIDYKPDKRHSGKTKYNVQRMFRLALQGITSFSTAPLYMAVYIGFFLAIASLLYLPYVIYSFLVHDAIAGWTSLILTIAFFGGVQMMLIGILGIYIGKLFMQAKNRPNYIIRSTNLSHDHT